MSTEESLSTNHSVVRLAHVYNIRDSCGAVVNAQMFKV